MIILFVGPQASGKGTQAKIISKKLGFCHISTGDLLRDAKGELKQKVDSYINKGKLFPDELIAKLLKQKIKETKRKKDIILDGFPRNLNQSEELDKIMKINKIFEISISDQEALKRLNGRWSCRKCRLIYNIFTAPKPKHDKICDKCGQALVQREDDADKDAIKKRLEIYHSQTEPMLEKYKGSVIKINGEQSIEDVTKDILEKLN